MVQWMNTWSLTWNCSKNKPSVHQLFWLVIIYQLSWPAKKKLVVFLRSRKQKKKSGSVIFPTTLRELSGLSLHPDVYNFLYVLSHQLPSFCLMNFQSVRPSISTLFLLPRSCSFFIIYGLSLCYIHRLWLRVGWSTVGGWAVVGLHVFKQTEIFMYVCMCRCVRAASRVPLPGPSLRFYSCL